MITALIAGLVVLKSPSFAVLPAVVGENPKLPNMIDREARDYLGDVVARRIAWDLDKRGLDVMGPNMLVAATERGKIEREKGVDPFTIAYFVRIAEYVKADYYIGVSVDRMTQANRGEAVAAMGKGSETTIEARLWLFDPTSRRLVVVPDREPLRARYQGPYLGTAKSGDLYGDPDDKRSVIVNEQKKRAGAYAEAVWSAISPKLLPYMNEKPRETSSRGS